MGGNGEPPFLVQARPKWSNAPFVRVEFNPSRNSMGEVHTMMNFILPGGYAALVEQGRCTRVDIAIDVHMVRPAQLLVTHQGFQIAKLHAKSGAVTGYELGSKESGKHFSIYDKAVQLKKENANTKWKFPIPDHPVTRVEARVKDRFPAAQLKALANPFANLMISDFGSTAANDDDTKLLMWAVMGVGAQTVLSGLSASGRKVAKQRLSTAAASWWEPAMYWQAWPEEASKVLTPPPPAYDLSLHKAKPLLSHAYTSAGSHLAH
jgi:hypothetical protein